MVASKTAWLFSLLMVTLPTSLARVNCRYNATAPAKVNYSTCTQLASKYEISLSLFMQLNPLIDPDCSSIEAGREYCVAGSVLETTTDGTCGFDSPRSCLGYAGGQCCNSQTLKCGKTAEDCAAGVCINGLCSVPDPQDFSLDGTCGPLNGKKCGGKWGTCCNKSGRCGSGQDFCDASSCWSGNCTLAEPQGGTWSPSPIWVTGNSSDGTCGAKNNNQICNTIWGYCCASSGKCGDGELFCGQGCQPQYGNCTDSTPPPKPPGPGDLSPDGTCGTSNGGVGFVCAGSAFGDCCSASGFCGNSTAHCTPGSCQPGFGKCAAGDPVSPDGSCGGAKGFTCKGSSFGDCCSSGGWCGTTDGHCKGGCQDKFGACTGSNISIDGSCGAKNGGKVCKGSGFGDCCSSGGWCGSTDAHCKSGCQTDYGTCVGGSGGGTNTSPDGTCGATNKNHNCKGSGYGDCCSSGGWCGSTDGHCKAGCQTAFGTCTGSNVSSDGSCGPNKGGKICTGSGFGDCCSAAGFCGSTGSHCGSGCRPNFGKCGDKNVSGDGSCGPNKGSLTCTGSGFGKCCSSAGFCGATAAHCGTGCRPNFGVCG